MIATGFLVWWWHLRGLTKTNRRPGWRPDSLPTTPSRRSVPRRVGKSPAATPNQTALTSTEQSPRLRDLNYRRHQCLWAFHPAARLSKPINHRGVVSAPPR